ncbi:hypothetical protein Hdeb2414_s0014g00422391 [Helianthus debilis subsp. tardiflorus]
MPPNRFNSFAGLFDTQGNYHGIHYEEEKKQSVEEIIDVTEEMNVENLTEITKKAMMAQLKEVLVEMERKRVIWK